jgi:hypothetical protein
VGHTYIHNDGITKKLKSFVIYTVNNNEQRISTYIDTMDAANPIVIEDNDHHDHDHDPIQKEMDVILDILEENQNRIPEGEYLRGMNALGTLHKHKRATLSELERERERGRVNEFGGNGDMLRSWMTIEEIEDGHDELYNEIMDVANDIVVEICGGHANIFDVDVNLVDRGDEREVFRLLMNYKPQEGNAGYETNPTVLHHAIQIIMERLFDDTIHELDIVRPVSCQCGWRGPQGNWDRHISNARHQRWVAVKEENRKEAVRMAIAALSSQNATDTSGLSNTQ